MNNPFNLSGKKILITGASSGIGRQTAISMSEMGAELVISARDSDRLVETLDLLTGKNHQVISADLIDEVEREALVEECPLIDGLVSCAGIIETKPIKFINQKSFANMMDVNFFSSINLVIQLFNSRKIKNNSSIVFIGSIAGVKIATKGNAMYGATKAALDGMVKAMALEFAPRKIRVNNIAPGMIQTEMVEDLEGALSKEAIELDKKRYPLGTYGTPEDVANACIYFISDASRWVTGSTMILDGGYTIQ